MLSLPSSFLGPANGSQETITTSSSQATTTASEHDKDVSAAAARLIASLNELVGRDGRLVMGWQVSGKLVRSLSDADDRVFDDIVKDDQMKEHRQVLEQMAESLEVVSSKMRLAEKRRVDRELAQSKKRAEELDTEMRQARQAWEKRREEMQQELDDVIVKRDQLTGDLTTVKAAKRKLEADGKMLQA